VTEGGGPLVPTELPLLTEEEQASNVRISCQVKVRGDVSVVVPEELFLVREYTGVVEHVRDLTHDIKEIRIRLKDPGRIEFNAGRYVQIETPPYGDNPEAVYRAYSISSPPSDDGHVELIIRLVPGGICTTWVFTLLREGDDVRFNGPYGRFGLSESDAPMVWIAGGSGMAPFWGIIRHMRERDIRRKCTYFFGALTRKDLFLLDEFHKLETEMPGFKFVPALSAPTPEDKWEGETGLITEAVDRHVGDLSGTECYLCGSGGMIRAAIQVLKNKGAKDESIFYDEFT
jgi:Na+-transporting NADH:ubiquinone oxidoreductase subunit F